MMCTKIYVFHSLIKNSGFLFGEGKSSLSSSSGGIDIHNASFLVVKWEKLGSLKGVIGGVISKPNFLHNPTIPCTAPGLEE